MGKLAASTMFAFAIFSIGSLLLATLITAAPSQVPSSSSSLIVATNVKKIETPVLAAAVASESDHKKQPSAPHCCAAACEKIFHHGETNSKTAASTKSLQWFACHRGCRFFSLIELLAEGQNMQAIKASCATACGEAYKNDQKEKEACKEGCSNQVAMRQSKLEEANKASAKSSSTYNLNIPLTGNEAWEPGFVFRVGWSRSAPDQYEERKTQPIESHSDNPIESFKDFLSGFISQLTSPSAWISQTKSSYTYLLGKGADGKEKLVFLNDAEKVKDTKKATNPTLAKSSTTTPKPKTQSHVNPSKALQKLLPSLPKPTVKPKDYRVYAAPYWMGTAYVTAEDGQEIKQVTFKTRIRPTWWDYISSGNDGSPRWLVLTLFGIFLAVFLWICCSTIFLSHQLTLHENTLKAKGYVRLNPDDPESKELLQDIDDIYEDDDYYYLPCERTKLVVGAADSAKPPSYEEAQATFDLIPEFQVLGAKDLLVSSNEAQLV